MLLNNSTLITNLYYNILILSVFLCVCSAIDSAPVYQADMRPVSWDPVWPERGTYGKIFSKKWPVAEISKENYATNGFPMEKS
jgi:hypothetical protein